jgi:hypothetical protein
MYVDCQRKLDVLSVNSMHLGLGDFLPKLLSTHPSAINRESPDSLSKISLGVPGQLIL